MITTNFTSICCIYKGKWLITPYTQENKKDYDILTMNKQMLFRIEFDISLHLLNLLNHYYLSGFVKIEESKIEKSKLESRIKNIEQYR